MTTTLTLSLDDLSHQLVTQLAKGRGALAPVLAQLVRIHHLNPAQTIELKRRYKLNKELVA